ncbi:alpha/beta family hydrolase [Marinagarivorans cellulosilyticus]|uniref:KANL3/Tex30 alpha/beta hydrolase-like domain-containing protein n=1 Tax=Marinagarivorans cellulosilyticus TaxID=2721545 RepID=A0AAN2BKV0_9GAMM|nr:alpha/beta family hydrolase [Marinagarivorans cellulosilyticus]BCD98463.1 hypothetical protein MARGE09_P2664 [Marinagarivorans cellulosilyticus]
MNNPALKHTLCGKPVLINKPRATTKATLLLAHGAGGAMDTPFMESIAATIASDANIEVIRFEFEYMHQRRIGGSKRPPPKVEKLAEEWSKWLTHFKNSNAPLLIGGKSMGGRIATLINSHHETPSNWLGVVCLGYPFHPQNKPDVLRTEHLSKSRSPVLIVQGSRDPFGNSEEVASYALPPLVTTIWIDSANHDLKPLKRSGSTQSEALLQAASAIGAFGQNLYG